MMNIQTALPRVRQGIVYRSRRGGRTSGMMFTQTRPTKELPRPAIAMVMGVSGYGKSTIGALFASRLRWEYEDAD